MCIQYPIKLVGGASEFDINAPVLEDGITIQWTASDFEDPPNQATCDIEIRLKRM